MNNKTYSSKYMRGLFELRYTVLTPAGDYNSLIYYTRKVLVHFNLTSWLFKTDTLGTPYTCIQYSIRAPFLLTFLCSIAVNSITSPCVRYLRFTQNCINNNVLTLTLIGKHWNDPSFARFFMGTSWIIKKSTTPRTTVNFPWEEIESTT